MADQKTKVKIVGVLADTHNLLRPEAVEVLKNADLIIHAGDICRPEIIEELKNLAPLIVVRGNNDRGRWSEDIPIYKAVEIDEILVYVIHDIKDLNAYPAPPGANVVISGHSHKPLIKQRNDILYVNPGSAGPRRFNLPVSMAKLTIKRNVVSPELIQMPV
jgi:putative phosphoesterase